MHFVVQAEVNDGLLLLHNMTKEMVLLSHAVAGGAGGV